MNLIRLLSRTAYDRTRDLLTKHREDVEKVAQLLLTKEVITREDMRDLLGKRPFARGDDMDKWLDEHGPNKKGEVSAPPPLEERGSSGGGTVSEQPEPTTMKRYEDRL